MLASGDPPRIYRASQSGPTSSATEIGRDLAEQLIVLAGEEIAAR
jgi:hypothetical protein